MSTWGVVFVAQGWDRSLGDAGSLPRCSSLPGWLEDKEQLGACGTVETRRGRSSSALLSILRTDLHLGKRPHHAYLLGLRTWGDKAPLKD